MCVKGDEGLFILRFSKHMIRPNPRRFSGGKPRYASGRRPDMSELAENVQRGFRYYNSFEYNKELPLYYKIKFKKGSLAKYLRYHFLNNTGVRIIGSVSPEEFAFSLKNFSDISRFCNILKFSSSKNFEASSSHIADIQPIMPDDKSDISELGFNGCDTFFLTPFEESENYVELMNFIKYEINCSNADIFCAAGKSYIKIRHRHIREISEKLYTHSLVKRINAMPEIRLYEKYIRHNELTPDCIMPRSYEMSYPKAAVVDSGLSENSYLKEWEFANLSFLNKKEKNSRHGTFVCGRLLSEKDSFGGITVLNVEIIPSGGFINIDNFYRQMDEMLKRYHQTVKIYNISLGTNIPVSDNFSLASAVMDELQYKYDVLFIVSAGNSFEEGVGRITSPAESVNSITVGSVSHIDTNYQSKYSPSLFSRHGPGAAGFNKPEVTSFGGAHEKRFGKLFNVGVFSIGTDNELAEDSGTSHAAPLVTSLAAKIYHKYSHAFKSPCMAKALIIHYTFMGSHIREHDIYKGYGTAPQDIKTDENTVTFLHSGTAVHRDIVELSDIPVPEVMISSGIFKGEIVATLSCTAKVDIDFPSYYTMFKLEMSLGYYKRGRWTSLITSKNMVTSSDKKCDYNITWQPVKVYSRRFTRTRIPASLSLRLIPSKRDFYTAEHPIPYSLAISFIHKEKLIHTSLLKHRTEAGGILEPAHELWKNC